jgi:hypothetical protein
MLLAIAALTIWQEHRANRLMAETAALQAQVEQAASLRMENQKLAKRLKAATEDSDAQLRELMRLRGQAGAMRETQQENARLKAERPRSVARPARDASEPPEAHYTPQQWAFFVERLNFSKKLGLAISKRAQENGGQVPSDLESAASWLATNHVPNLEGGSANGVNLDRFELIYKGRLTDLQAPERTVLAREKDPVEVHSGRWIRMYVMADGSVQQIGANTGDGFAALEKEMWPR